jgi:hypothetical protein
MHATVIVIPMLRHSVRGVAIFAVEAGEHAERRGHALKRQHREGQRQDQFLHHMPISEV